MSKPPGAPADLIATATRELEAAGVGSPRVDAELLLAHVLRRPRSALLTLDGVTPAEKARFDEFVARRVNREPLQYIVGVAPFRHLELAVGPGVFIPRPETELLVDVALQTLHHGDAAVDLCAGSGALGLALLDELPGLSVIAVERDPVALGWLRRNAAGTSLQVHAADVADPSLLVDRRGTIDVVVTNPPYVPESVAVDPEVAADPRVAVFAGADGLDLMPAVIARAAELLRAGGQVVVEHDESHARAVPGMLADDPRWAGARLHHDLAGRPRFSTAFRTDTAA